MSMTNLNLVWCDGHVYNEENKQLLERLREIDRECREFEETGECQRFLGRGVHDPRRFLLITSGYLGENFVPKIHDYKNILAIYVYCGDKVKHKAWSAQYDKVKVITDPSDLLSEIKTAKTNYS